MKIAVSNIAWNDQEQPQALAKLSELGVLTIEIIPGRLMGNSQELEVIKSKGYDFCCFQGLLFNTKDLILFASQEAEQNLMSHLILLDKYASELKAKSFVFGSPKNRWIPDEMPYEVAEEKAIKFFRTLGDQIDNYFCLEAVAESYGCNFLRTTDELGKFIRKVNHPKIKMNFDLGAIIANQENLNYLVDNYSDLFGHVHVSEPNLRVPGLTKEFHQYHIEFAKLIKENGINSNLVSIEMLRDASYPLEEQLELAVNFTKQIYDS